MMTQLQANVLAAQLEAVGKQLALASQVALEEQRRAQVLFQLAWHQQRLARPALTHGCGE